MSDGYIGEIRAIGESNASGNWHLCDGSLASVQELPALFSMIGTTYGGDGQTTFALPNLAAGFYIATGSEC